MRKEIIGDAVLYCGDCLDVASELEAASIDALVSDPPYGLEFMGKDWDRGVPGVHFWQAFYRVVKPGAHLLAFGGTRTIHRQVCAIENAGWEIRDQLGWLYGSGFPKSKNVALSIDKGEGMPNRGHRIATASRFHPDGTPEPNGENLPPYEAKTAAARAWEGWGTALKPAWEPVCLARKPLVGTVAANVMRFGTGAINVDGCRVGDEERFNESAGNKNLADKITVAPISKHTETTGRECIGRWPANIMHDGSDEVVAVFPEDQGSSAARFFYTAKASREDRDEGLSGPKRALNWSSGTKNPGSFQSPNTDRTARNFHPTVKPTDLMRWCIRLVTPPAGIVFDPFMGSGSTGKAAMLEGKRFIGAELSPEYFEIACRRIEAAYMQAKAQPSLFDELEATKGKADDVLQPSFF